MPGEKTACVLLLVVVGLITCLGCELLAQHIAPTPLLTNVCVCVCVYVYVCVFVLSR